MLNGVYDLTVLAMGQERKGIMTLSEEGNKLSGSLEALGNKFTFNEGTSDGNKFAFEVHAQGKKLAFWGTIDENGKLDGEGKMAFIDMMLIGQRR